jgi:hypothetical protein
MNARSISDLLSPPPRSVPLSVRLRVLFGGFSNQFGWLFVGFGMIFVWVFTLNADFASPLLFLLPTQTTVGVVEGVERTNASENDVTVYSVDYVFFDRSGAQHRDTSYSTGNPAIGSRVTVEYLSMRASISRVMGMRRAPFGPFAAFAMLFPLIGLAFLSSGLKQGLRANRLLAKGRIAHGTLISSQPTGATINNRPVIKLTFAFKSYEGTEWHAIAKTHQPEDLRDEQEEPLLYDPHLPSEAVLLDDLPGSTTFDPSGQLEPAGIWETARTLILPALTVLGHGTYLLISSLL